MAETSELTTKRFRLIPMTSDRVTDSWIKWTADADLMRQLNTRPLNMSRADLQRYVAGAPKRGRAIVGIFTKVGGEHIGLYETQGSAPQHANVTIDVFVDQNRYDLSNVLTETDPVLLRFLKQQYKAEKAVARLPETYLPAIRHFERTGWLKEGVMRKEYPAADGVGRVDVVQFGKLLES